MLFRNWSVLVAAAARPVKFIALFTMHLLNVCHKKSVSQFLMGMEFQSDLCLF